MAVHNSLAIFTPNCSLIHPEAFKLGQVLACIYMAGDKTLHRSNNPYVARTSKRTQTRQNYDLNYLSIKAKKRGNLTKLHKAAPDDTNPMFTPFRFKTQPLRFALKKGATLA